MTSRERACLSELLRRYSAEPDRRPAIEAEIEAQYTRRLAILAIDTCGFSRSTWLHGIIPRLAVLARLHHLTEPIVEREGGRVLKAGADNIFATFADPAAAVAAAREILAVLDRSNSGLPAPERVAVAIGVGYGDVLAIGDDDVYGDEMNLACKLGEDLAQRGEILLTPAARAALAGSGWSFEDLDFNVSGIDVPAYRLIGRTDG